MKPLLLQTAGTRFFLRALLTVGTAVGLSATANADPEKPPAIMDYAQLHRAGWVTPFPPYPIEAVRRGESGTVFLYLKTDAAGKVSDAHVADQPESTKSEALRKGAVSYTRVAWHGPPNSQTVVSILYSRN